MFRVYSVQGVRCLSTNLFALLIFAAVVGFTLSKCSSSFSQRRDTHNFLHGDHFQIAHPVYLQFSWTFRVFTNGSWAGYHYFSLFNLCPSYVQQMISLSVQTDTETKIHGINSKKNIKGINKKKRSHSKWYFYFRNYVTTLLFSQIFINFCFSLRTYHKRYELSLFVV